MPPIDWTNVPALLFERLVACLLSDLHQARRVDGAGGDGGIDMHFEDAAGLHIFECKSFTGRLGRDAGRRTQVERSLKRAARHVPATWTLIVPIDPTPGEQKWFDALQPKYAFALDWPGLAWLETEVARRPWLRRHFIDGDAERTVELLRDLNSEQAALAGGAPDAAGRIAKVVDLLDETDPYFRYRITSGAGTEKVELFPRYPGAEEDRPIRFGFRLNEDDHAAYQKARADLERALAFGDEIELDESLVRDMVVDMPANLGGAFPTGIVKIGPVEVETIQLRAALTAVDEAGSVVAALPITFTERRAGLRGVTLTGTDRAKFLRATAVVEPENRSLKLNIDLDITEPFLPGDVLPAARLAAQLGPPNRLRITVEGTDVGDHALTGHEPLNAGLVRMLEALDRVQSAIGNFFTVPPTLTAGDQRNIHVADRLVTGEEVAMTFPCIEATLEVQDAAGTVAHLRGTTSDLTMPVDEFPIRVFGVDLDLRPLSITFDEALIVDGDAIADSGTVIDGAELIVQVAAVPGTSAHVRRVQTPVAYRR